MKGSDLTEEKRAKRFKLLMEATDKKFKLEKKRTMIEERKVTLEEKKFQIAANAEDAKMLSLNVATLDADARMIVQSARYQMLQRQNDELIGADNEDTAEAEAEAAYAAATTP